jgi:hypothetical protein
LIEGPGFMGYGSSVGDIIFNLFLVSR